MARKKKEDGGGPTGNEWLGTYSDMVTLLMTLFVLLYSMSSINEDKVHAIAKAFSVMNGKAADSILEYDKYDGSQPIVGGESEDEDDDTIDETSMYEQVHKFIEENQLDAEIESAENKNGVVLQLSDDILFETGKADLLESSHEILDKISKLIESVPNPIVIEGHTDNIPIRNSIYKDNWDLSTARASNVLRYFTLEKHQDPTRFSSSGYGEYSPRVENTSDDNRAKNRRVNILIVSSSGGE